MSCPGCRNVFPSDEKSNHRNWLPGRMSGKFRSVVAFSYASSGFRYSSQTMRLVRQTFIRKMYLYRCKGIQKKALQYVNPRYLEWHSLTAFFGSNIYCLTPDILLLNYFGYINNHFSVRIK